MNMGVTCEKEVERAVVWLEETENQNPKFDFYDVDLLPGELVDDSVCVVYVCVQYRSLIDSSVSSTSPSRGLLVASPAQHRSIRPKHWSSNTGNLSGRNPVF